LAFFRDPQDPRSFDESAVTDKGILALCQRIALKLGDQPKGSSLASLTITLKNGSVLTEKVTAIKGTPALPPDRNDVYQKYALLTRHCDRQKLDEIFERLQAIEGEKGFDWLKV
jgi:2-methylcitrate dehydratase PrpD